MPSQTLSIIKLYLQVTSWCNFYGRMRMEAGGPPIRLRPLLWSCLQEMQQEQSILLTLLFLMQIHEEKTIYKAQWNRILPEGPFLFLCTFVFSSNFGTLCHHSINVFYHNSTIPKYYVTEFSGYKKQCKKLQIVLLRVPKYFWLVQMFLC